ncbi:hypothetical protein GOD70_22480 [Sinorhizobium medicae]|nr:hypothetical protein [Sinorhizobium medicae]MDX0808682.1 hypothetical protein [Sinorhizobium medicae]
MNLAVAKSNVSFTLHVRCVNCYRESVKCIEVPVVDDAPLDTGELMESAFLDGVHYRCGSCEGLAGQIFGISGGLR